MHRLSRLARQSSRPLAQFLVPVGQSSTRLHSTFLLEGTIGNANNRLRLQEERYAGDVSTPFPKQVNSVMKSLSEETARDFPNGFMMISEIQAKLLHHLVSILRPKKVLEIGTFTGYSAIAMASALGPNASLITLELDPCHLAVARRFVKEAQLDNKIKFQQGPALESMLEFMKQTPQPQFDIIFLDADKGGYIKYFDHIMENNLLTENGVIIVDNVLFFGQVHQHAGYEDSEPVQVSKNVKKLAKKAYEFNKYVMEDDRVEAVVLPIFDGVTIIRRANPKAL
ncbi:O-methyltransferase-domain-containing protein [Phycomyces nitens]|nr:O-methyltransferase-domain-containing protein [Phycomyces nitens]